ncbi:erythromycin esterase family protein [Streptomyces sp. HPF1205]|uniref:erythromycin esterase family protein n=1 Tax=Streptomyces sp. HPF1205 TaxID=2873262 RepID=UPI001CED42D6|nr:erythromycin esterase family protein [Streptomyces sp. HPF1205]
MPSPPPRALRRLSAAVLTVLLALLMLAAGQPAPAAQSRPRAGGADPGVVAALTRAARPLRTTEPAGPFTDLGPFGRQVGRARLVGLGEGSHGTHEFFTLHDRLFRYLVREKGFATFSREAGWNAGLDVNAWVQGGPGDIREIIRRDFQADWMLFATEEFARLFEWMRAYNASHDHRHRLQYMGFDVGPVEPALYGKVLAYVARRYPALERRFADLYAGHPTGSVEAATIEFRHRPLVEREDFASRAQQAYELLAEQRRPAPDPIDLHSAASIAQDTRFYAYGNTPEEDTASLEYRDRTMASNVAWWYRLTGDKMVVSAHNSHVAYLDPDPQFIRQGGYLRRWFGSGYTNLRTAFYQGSFNSTYVVNGRYAVRAYTVGPPDPGFNEYTLGAVPVDKYFLDLRALRPPAKQWAAQPHPNRFFGGFWEPGQTEEIALSKFSDMLIFIHRSTAARMLPGT